MQSRYRPRTIKHWPRRIAWSHGNRRVFINLSLFDGFEKKKKKKKKKKKEKKKKKKKRVRRMVKRMEKKEKGGHAG